MHEGARTGLITSFKVPGRTLARSLLALPRWHAAQLPLLHRAHLRELRLYLLAGFLYALHYLPVLHPAGRFSSPLVLEGASVSIFSRNIGLSEIPDRPLPGRERR